MERFNIPRPFGLGETAARRASSDDPLPTDAMDTVMAHVTAMATGPALDHC